MRVAIADDQPAVRSALRLVLEQEPDVTVVVEAANATGLLQQAAKEQFDLLFLDWELPGLEAEQLIRLVRFEQPEVGIIAMSSRSEARATALASGADGFVGKEYSTRLAQEVLRDIRDKATQAGFGVSQED